MPIEDHIPIARLQRLERTSATVPEVENLAAEIRRALASLPLPDLHGREIAVAVGSRGIARLREIVRAAVGWLKDHGANPFAFPAMGSHGGSTAEGQRAVLDEYGVTPEYIGCEIRSDMETVGLGSTSEGFQVFMDRNAWQAGTVLVINRVKPHTDFYGRIESGMVKMMAIGMGKADGARECHRAIRKYGNERAIRAAASVVLASGRILAGLGVVENELHQIARVCAAAPPTLIGVEEEALELARRLVARLPFSKLDLLMVDEMGKNISGSGMDTKVIGRGVKTPPEMAPSAPDIRVIYVRDLTHQSGGNALGAGLADLMHERLRRKIDPEKTYINARTSLNLPVCGLPLWAPSDRVALDLALGSIGSPGASEQRLAWIRSTLELDRIAISEALTEEARALKGWRLAPGVVIPEFDELGNLTVGASGVAAA